MIRIGGKIHTGKNDETPFFSTALAKRNGRGENMRLPPFDGGRYGANAKKRLRLTASVFSTNLDEFPYNFGIPAKPLKISLSDGI